MKTICENCGSEVTLPDGITEGFCGDCGAKVVAPEPETVAAEPETTVEENVPVAPEPETVVEETAPVAPETPPVAHETVLEEFEPEPAPAENKPVGGLDAAIAKLPPALQNKRLLAIIAAVILIFIIGVFAVIALVFLSGNGSYKSAESKTFDALTTVNGLSGLSGGLSDGYATEFEIEYTPSGDILDLLALFLSQESDYFTVDGVVSVFGNSVLADVSAHASDIDARVVGAFDGNAATVAFPDATDYVIYRNLTETEDEKAVTINQNDLAKTVNAIKKEYFKIAERSVEVKKGDELKGGDIEVKADRYTFKFTREDSYNLALFAIDEIRKNDSLVEYITAAYRQNNEDFDFEDILDDFESFIDDEIFDMSESDKMSTMFRMKAWVYKGNIVSRELDNFYEATDVKLSYTVLANTKAAYAKFAASNDYSDYRVTADFEREGKYWGGDIRLELDDEASIKASVKNLTLSGEYLTGKATVKGTASYTDFDIDLDFAKIEKGQQIVIEGSINEEEIGEVSITYDTKKINSLKLPTYDEDDLIDPNIAYDDDETYEKFNKMSEDLRKYFMN
ncbi:MAG: procyclic acidic repetitive family protein [Ruminococcus sp.]|jgi:hypothetical protein|nr:procyclic acidic repetitive family protein [Ruminococcus sp.]